MIETTSDIVRKKHDAPAFHYLFFNSDSILQDVSIGYQNVETKLAVNDSTSFHAFSVTKTFTAVAIMQLVQQHVIQLEDTVTKYIPSFKFSKPVTIRNLLCHQSGIANPLPLKWTHLEQEHKNFDYRTFSDSIILSNLKLKRSPGKKYSYSNINYLVLGRLLEEITGSEYKEYITTNILNRIPTKEYIGFEVPESNHATGYHPNSWFQGILLDILLDKNKMTFKANDAWRGFKPFYINGLPYGGIIGTPNSLMEFCRALLRDDDSLLSKPLIKEMLSAQQTNNGKGTEMCLGWFKGVVNDLEYYCHAGGGGGYYTEIRLYPTLGCGSVIMTNSSGMKDDRILDLLDVNSLNKMK